LYWNYPLAMCLSHTREVLISCHNTKTYNKPDDNRRSHAGNRTGPNFFLGNAQIATDFTQEWPNSKPYKKGNEETPPRTVKGSHVRTTERTKADLAGLVILVCSNANRNQWGELLLATWFIQERDRALSSRKVHLNKNKRKLQQHRLELLSTEVIRPRSIRVKVRELVRHFRDLPGSTSKS